MEGLLIVLVVIGAIVFRKSLSLFSDSVNNSIQAELIRTNIEARREANKTFRRYQDSYKDLLTIEEIMDKLDEVSEARNANKE